MMPRPWLSVLIPAHNGAEWIGHALSSLGGDDAAGVEVVIIDSSPDGETARAVRAHANGLDLQFRHDPALLSWVTKTNVAASTARAEYLCLLHQDDYWMPRRAVVVRQWIEDNPTVSVHLHPTIIVDSSATVLGQWRCPFTPGDVDRDTFLRRLIVQNFIAIPAPVFRRELYLETGGMDPKQWYTADWDLWLRMGSHCGAMYHDDFLTCFRVHPDSQTMKGSLERLDEMRAQQETVVAKYIGGVRADIRSAVLRRAQASIEVNIALAAAAAGRTTSVWTAAMTAVRLGPVDFFRYTFESRIVERVRARINARRVGRL